MPLYTCERCHYRTELKSDFKKHLQKINPCLETFSTKDSRIILEELLKPKEFQCTHCDKSFAYSQTLARHVKAEHPNISINSHNHTNESHNTTDSHNQSYNTTSTNQSHNTNSLNTTTNNNTTVNIHLNVFGQEQLDHILEDENFLTHCARSITTDGLQKILKSIWCNKEVPENHNVHLKRERKPRLVNVYVDDGEPRWVEKLADDVIDDMIKKGTGILQVHNSKLYRFDEEHTDSDTERYDIRNNALGKISSKARGYQKRRDSVVTELRNLKNDQGKQK